MIKVLIVDDSLLIRKILTEILESDREIKVVGTAADGEEAIQKTALLKPDLITMDIEMPVMDGIEATKKIVEKYAIPILVITSPEVKKQRDVPFHAIKAGAIDIWEKPEIGTKKNFIENTSKLIREVKIVSSIRVIKRQRTGIKRDEQPGVLINYNGGKDSDIIVIGSSTGGPKELFKILSTLPGDFTIPILIVQHIGKEFIEGLVRWLSQSCMLPVKVAGKGDKIIPGEVYFAPGGYHMEVDSQKTIILSTGKPVNSCKPSIDILFKAVARQYGRRALGVLLTGMGVDGALGLLKMKEMGSKTIAQSKESSVVFGMPAKAIEYGAANEILSIEEITLTIQNAGIK